MLAATAEPGVVTWPVWTTTARVVSADPAAVDAAVAAVQKTLAAVDAAANRFDADSEVNRLCSGTAGSPRPVGAVLWCLLEAAVNVAAATGGLVDPTIGSTLSDLGYDRSITALADGTGRPLPVRVRRAVGWREIHMQRELRTVHVPAGCEIDLGATAKAWAADSAASAAAAATGAGVLVSLGGDLAFAGPAPEDGWPVRISDDHSRPRDSDPLVVARDGALATSSTAVRGWWSGRQRLHHIVDPRTGQPADGPWRTASVAAKTCVAANAAATAALILGSAAVGWLEARALPARLVAHDGAVTTVAGWPNGDAATWVR